MESKPISDAKAALRHAMRGQLRTLHPADRDQHSTAIREALRESGFWRAAETIALFAPLPTEPDLEGLWPATDKRLCLPRMTGETMLFHEVGSLVGLVETDRVREPDPELHPVVRTSEIDLIVVPGLAFTRDGDRLGRGAGYYDRFLPTLPENTKRIGVAFPFQILARMPVEPHDHPLDAIISGAP